MSSSKKAFTLIELLVVIAIIGILATVSIISLSNARAKSRDAKRAGDMKQIQTALELFFNDKNRYPTVEEWNTHQIYSTSTSGTSTYMQVIPSAPTPVDGNCSDSQNFIGYSSIPDGSSYSISFCLGNNTGTLTAGPKCLTPGGILDLECTPCGIEQVAYGGHNYSTVLIGDQCWLAENINVGTFIGSGSSAVGFDGSAGTDDDCVDIDSPSGWWSCQGYAGIQKYCYDNDTNNCTTDGGLYDWAEALGLPGDCNNASSVDNGDGTYTLNCPTSGSQTVIAKQQGICPSGWHIPSDSSLGTNSDWRTLEQGLATDPNCDSETDYCSPAGDKLKPVSGCSILGDPNCGSSDFEGKLAGLRGVHGEFLYRGYNGTWFWSSSPSPSTPYYAWSRYLYIDSSQVRRSFAYRPFGLSVRCIRD